jgi:hypothetical protein
MESITYKQPPTMNKLLNTARTNRYVAAADKKRWTDYFAKESLVSIQDSYKRPFIAAEISYFKSNSDLDNLGACFKSVLDGLVKAKLIPDDNLSVIKPFMFYKAVKIKTKETAFFRLYITDSSTEYTSLILSLLG